MSRIADIRARIIAREEVTLGEVITEWQLDRDDLEDRIELALTEKKDAIAEANRPPDWGNCRRGCPPAYLDRNRFCSPACAMGAPRGQFVTVAVDDAQETMFYREQHGF